MCSHSPPLPPQDRADRAARYAKTQEEERAAKEALLQARQEEQEARKEAQLRQRRYGGPEGLLGWGGQDAQQDQDGSRGPHHGATTAMLGFLTAR